MRLSDTDLVKMDLGRVTLCFSISDISDKGFLSPWMEEKSMSAYNAVGNIRNYAAHNFHIYLIVPVNETFNAAFDGKLTYTTVSNDELYMHVEFGHNVDYLMKCMDRFSNSDYKSKLVLNREYDCSKGILLRYCEIRICEK